MSRRYGAALWVLGLVACVGHRTPLPTASPTASEHEAFRAMDDERRRAPSAELEQREREARESEQRSNDEIASTKAWEAKAAVERKAHVDRCAADYASRVAAAKLALAEIAFSHAPRMGLCQKIGATFLDEPRSITHAQRDFFYSQCQAWTFDRLDNWYVWLDKSGDCADVDEPPLRIVEATFEENVAAIRAIKF